jgi:hypothetical protein
VAAIAAHQGAVDEQWGHGGRIVGGRGGCQ